jgi:HSP20 family molecular chaperone IbpA
MSDQQGITQATENTPERVSRRAMVSPPVDIYENADEVLVVTDVPGTPQEGLNIHFDKDQLFIEATTNTFDEGLNPLFREFGSVDYRRVFELAPGIDVEKIQADLKNGVLSIHLPKSAATKPRRIQIKAE